MSGPNGVSQLPAQTPPMREVGTSNNAAPDPRLVSDKFGEIIVGSVLAFSTVGLIGLGLWRQFHKKPASVEAYLDEKMKTHQYSLVLRQCVVSGRADLFMRYFDEIRQTLSGEKKFVAALQFAIEAYNYLDALNFSASDLDVIKNNRITVWLDYAKASESSLNDTSSAQDIIEIARAYEEAAREANEMKSDREPAARASAAQLFVRAAELLKVVMGSHHSSVANLYTAAARNFMRGPTDSDTVKTLQSILRVLPLDRPSEQTMRQTLHVGPASIVISLAEQRLPPSGLELSRWIMERAEGKSAIQARIDLATQLFVAGKFPEASTELRSISPFTQHQVPGLLNPLGSRDRVSLDPVEAALTVFHRMLGDAQPGLAGDTLAFDTLQAAILNLADEAWALNAGMVREVGRFPSRVNTPFSDRLPAEYALASDVAEMMRSKGASGATNRVAEKLMVLTGADYASVLQTLNGRPSKGLPIEALAGVVPDHLRSDFQRYLTTRQAEVVAATAATVEKTERVDRVEAVAP